MKREQVQMIASQRLVELLSRLNHQISLELQEMIRWRSGAVITYLDFGDSDDSISFIYSNKLNELISENSNTYISRAWNEKRADMRIGKVIKLIFGDRFPINMPKDSDHRGTRYDIESFVNLFKAERAKNVNYKNFSIIKGTTIVKWYNQKNHTRFAHEETPLGKSCMRYDESSKFLRLYSLNSDKINMLILKDDEGKIKGRAILWHLDNIDRIYMDRIYYVNDFDVELFKDYAREQGWLHKQRQTYGFSNSIVDTRNGRVYSWKEMYMEVRLNNTTFSKYPYLDTLSVYNPESGILCNNGKLLTDKPYINLIDYQGHYQVNYDERQTVFSRIYNRHIPRDDAFYCEIDDDWVYDGDQIYVHNSGGRYCTNKSENVFPSEVLGKTKYFLASSCVWSYYMRTWLFKDSVVEAYLDDKKSNRVLIHRKLIGKYFIKKGKIVVKMKNNGESKYTDYKVQFANHLPDKEDTFLYNRGRRRRRPTLGDYGTATTIGISLDDFMSEQSVQSRPRPTRVRRSQTYDIGSVGRPIDQDSPSPEPETPMNQPIRREDPTRRIWTESEENVERVERPIHDSPNIIDEVTDNDMIDEVTDNEQQINFDQFVNDYYATVNYDQVTGNINLEQHTQNDGGSSSWITTGGTTTYWRDNDGHIYTLDSNGNRIRLD